MDMVDTTTDVGKGLFYLYKKFDRIQIGGYIQPQFQVAQEEGIDSYNGGNFSEHVNNRFMLRRGRLRFDYVRYNKRDQPSVHFVFQFDGTERGVLIRDFWGRIFENELELFSFTGGMFARPFGYEINLSSSDRETPERGRMSQILMRTERDLGAMVSFDPRKKKHALRFLKLDIGVFNGQGLTAPAEYDSYKDVIGRLSLKPYPLSQTIRFSMGLSYLNGGIYQNSKYINRITSQTGKRTFITDSSESNIGGKAPRIYHGADAQLRLKTKWGFSELRGEYWWGTQTSSATTNETPPALLNEPYFIRKFNGGFLYFLQNIGNQFHQIGVKYDWFDPNIHMKGVDIGATGSGSNIGDIKYSTWSVGYNKYFHENLKLMLWYDFVKNENTSLSDFRGDIRDNVFTCRLQFRF